MPKSDLKGVKFLQSKHSWIYEWNDYPEGKRQRRCKHFRQDKFAAEQFALSHQYEKRQPQKTNQNVIAPPIEIAFEKYRQFARVELSPNSQRVIDQRLRILQGYFAGKGISKLDGIRPVTMEDFKLAYLKPGRSKKTYNNYVALLRSVMNKAIDLQMLPEDFPVRRFKSIPVPSCANWKARFFTQDEIDQVRAVLKGSMRIMFEMGLRTGFRMGEIINLTWQNIDFDRGIIQIENREGFRTKNQKDRSIAMTPELKNILQDLPMRHPVYLLVDKEGQPYAEKKNTRNLSKDFWRIFRRLKMEGVSFHTTRHTFASAYVMAGKPLYTVSKLLGHSTQYVTERYAHLSPGYLREAIAGVTYFDRPVGLHRSPAVTISERK